jgi:hypothetical protein
MGRGRTHDRAGEGGDRSMSPLRPTFPWGLFRPGRHSAEDGRRGLLTNSSSGSRPNHRRLRPHRRVWAPGDREDAAGHIRPDHVHLLLSAPPNLAPSRVMQAIKGKTSRHLMRDFRRLNKEFWGRHLWARRQSRVARCASGWRRRSLCCRDPESWPGPASALLRAVRPMGARRMATATAPLS